jgi:predicted O-methyltransferase YrrM
MQQQWNAVEKYIGSQLFPQDEALSGALAAIEAAGMPAISVGPAEGKLLTILARSIGARRVLEVGTLGAYSTICLARGLPEDGRIVTLELVPLHAQVARGNLENAGFSAMVDIRLGPALSSLEQLGAEGAEPFDLVFIDADKPNNPAYLDWALKLTRSGGLIIVDNVVRHGEVADDTSTDERVRGSRQVIELMGAEPRLSATAIQTVGSKGYDGFAIGLVL